MAGAYKNSKQVALWITGNAIWFILAFLFLFFCVINGPPFYSFQNLINIAFHSVVLGLLALAQTIILISGFIDLSIESSLAFSALIPAMMMTGEISGFHLDPMFAIFLCVGIGMTIGLFNGLLVTKLGLDSMLVTLAGMIFLRGMTLGLHAPTISPLPDAYAFLGGGYIFNIPVALFVFFALYILFHSLMRYTRFGKHIYAIGGNPVASIECGINVSRTAILAFMISGAIAASTGLMLAGKMNAITSWMGSGMVFYAFAAAVLGGVSLRGGRGSVIQTFGGALLIGVIDTGLTIARVSPYYIEATRGLLLLIAIIIDSLREKIRPRLIR